MLLTAWQKLHSFAAERYLGIRTTGWTAPINRGGVHYTPLPYQLVFRMLRRAQLGSDDVFIDVGCGKGRVVCCACRYPIRRVVALEVNGRLLAEAMENVSRVKGRKVAVEPVEGPAEEYEFRDASVIYLYNPFDQPTTHQVLGRIRDSYRAHPRHIRIIYANCRHEGALIEGGWLRRCEQWPADRYPGFGYPVSFWESV
jgi:SAM-dependent methyltransferase